METPAVKPLVVLVGEEFKESSFPRWQLITLFGAMDGRRRLVRSHLSTEEAVDGDIVASSLLAALRFIMIRYATNVLKISWSTCVCSELNHENKESPKIDGITVACVRREIKG